VSDQRKERGHHGRRARHRRGGGNGGAHQCRGGDLHAEVAGALRHVPVVFGDDGEPLEVARRVGLPLRLVVHVERVRRVPTRVERAAAAPVAERRAVGVRARVPDVVGEPAGVVVRHVRVQHAPPPWQVLDALRRHRHRRPPGAAEVERELGPAVEREDAPVALEVARRHALGVLVHQPEQVHLDARARPERRAAPRRQPLEQAGVEPLRVRHGGVLVAVRRPPDLADHDREAPEPDPLQRRHQRVEVGVEHVGVVDAVVHHRPRRRPAVEEGVVEREVVVAVEAEEGVDVDCERRAAAVEEPDHVGHGAGDVVAEPPRRRHRVARRRVVHVGVHRHRRLDPLPVPGLVERALDVPQRRHGGAVELAVVRLEERLVADGDVPDVDAAVEAVPRDVLLHPLPGAAVVADGGEHVVGDGDHRLDAGAGEPRHGRRVGVEDLHLLEPVVLEQPRHHLGRQPVRRHCAPVHPEPIHHRRRRHDHHSDHHRATPHRRRRHRRRIDPIQETSVRLKRKQFDQPIDRHGGVTPSTDQANELERNNRNFFFFFAPKEK
ncbi:Os11g0577866, partial [Oryza sativa Japonica Group]